MATPEARAAAAEGALPHSQDAASQEVIIAPSSGGVRLELGEVWRHRELVSILAWREIKIRYKQTVVGTAWAVVQPVLTMLVLSVLFGHLIGVSTGGTPYPLFSYSAIVPWTYFTHALTMTTMCLVNNHSLLTKVYFPRLVLPAAAVLAALVDFLIAFALLLLMMAFWRVVPGASFLALPLLVALTVALSLGCGLWLSAVNVEFRDVANVLPFITQVLMFATPIAYPSTLIPERWRAVYALNPMAGIIEGFRWSILGSPAAPWRALAISAAVTTVVLVGGLYFFRRREARFADIV